MLKHFRCYNLFLHKKNPLLFSHNKQSMLFYSTKNTILSSQQIISKEQIKELLNNKIADKDFILIDVREPTELNILPKIDESAHNIPLNDIGPAFLTLDDKRFKSQYGFDKPNIEQQIICYCKVGVRSQRACDILKEIGYKNALNYKGSANEWHYN
ncbi:hypothetical protein ABK040_000231 [Willaertia magna]